MPSVQGAERENKLGCDPSQLIDLSTPVGVSFAREEAKDYALIQDWLVFVNVFREQARSYSYKYARITDAA